MACARGEASPTQHTKLRLFAASGGFCQRPECNDRLFLDTKSKNIHIAEMAHVFAANDTGPRANTLLTSAERGAFENLILLCPKCHSIVDKAPNDFPDHLLKEWKGRHAERIAQVFGAIEYPNRAAARSAIEPALIENLVIFNQHGPDNEYRENPESEEATVWQRKMQERVLPNNRLVLAALDANRKHLRDYEVEVLEEFRQHIDDLEVRHLGDGNLGVGRRFPAGMDAILTED
jgi:hypothetical protein